MSQEKPTRLNWGGRRQSENDKVALKKTPQQPIRVRPAELKSMGLDEWPRMSLGWPTRMSLG